MTIEVTAATEIDPNDLKNLHFARDMKSEEYQRVFKKLNEIRNQNENIFFVCILGPTETEGMFRFIADADSNYYLPENKDAIEVVAPGTYYQINQLIPEKYQHLLLRQPFTEKNFGSDKWGTYLSGTAPIYDQQGRAIAILDLDMEVSDVYRRANEKFLTSIYFGLLFTMSSFGIIFFLHTKMLATE